MTEADSRIPVSLVVNGRAVVAEVEPRRLLVDFLRSDLGLTGTHVGCDTSQCGACTVHLDGLAVKSCTLLVAQASGGAITTIEGVAGPEGLHPVQTAFHQHHALQCGFCTPGMVMIALDILRREPAPTGEFIRHNLEGNLCRCTGYQNIVRAIEAAGEALARQAATAAAAD